MRKTQLTTHILYFKKGGASLTFRCALFDGGACALAFFCFFFGVFFPSFSAMQMCLSPHDRASSLMEDVFADNVAALKKAMEKPDFGEVVDKGACCYAGYTLAWFAAEGGARRCFEKLALYYWKNGKKMDTGHTRGLRTGASSMAQKCRDEQILDRIHKGYFHRPLSWKRQRLVWLGRRDKDSVLYYVPRDVLRLIVAACATKIVFSDPLP